MPQISELQLRAAQQLFKQKAAEIDKKDMPNFSETLSDVMNQIDQSQTKAGGAMKDFIAGKDIELHEVMALGQEAQLGFQLMLEVRNKLIEAYQELSRMPV
jgi:flagellar hook-basal body complex protein FliE